MKFSIVILHYQNAEVTRQCLEYLDALIYREKFNIVVVDNCSPNGSGYVLQEDYAKNENKHFILLNRNIGFACGNNEGYKYAKNKLNAEAIIVINSDLFISDRMFLQKLESVINDNPEDSIIAVDIVTQYGGHQNPFRRHPESTSRIRKIILRKRIGQIIYSIPLLNTAIIKRKPLTSTKNNTEKEFNELRNIVPHGACIIFTNNWIKKEEIAFLKGTFLFVEEEILFDYCCHNNYLIHYVPWLEVYHMEDASQNADAYSAVDKKRRQLKYEISSRKLLLKLRKSYKK